MPQVDDNEIPFSGARNRKKDEEVSDSAPCNFCQCPKGKQRNGGKGNVDRFEFDHPDGICATCGLSIKD